eukprot:g7986.t1
METTVEPPRRRMSSDLRSISSPSAGETCEAQEFSKETFALFGDEIDNAAAACISFSTAATTQEPDASGDCGEWQYETLMGPSSRCTSSVSFQPLPAASPSSTLILLDWDDTLFPTTWLESKKAFKNASKAWQDEQPEVHLSAEDLGALEEMDETARALVQTAAELGEVCCVTLAQRPWQEVSMKVFMPKLHEVWKELDIPVHYASEEPGCPRLSSSGPAARAIVKETCH